MSPVDENFMLIGGKWAVEDSYGSFKELDEDECVG